MALEQRLSQNLKLSQKLVMTPQLQMAIKLLPMTTLELKERIDQELLENPLLEEDDSFTPDPATDTLSVEKEFSQHHETADGKELDDYVQSSLEAGGALDGENTVDFEAEVNAPSAMEKLDKEEKTEQHNEQDMDFFSVAGGEYKMENISHGSQSDEEFERPVVMEESLQEHLLKQLGMSAKDEEIEKIGTLIIGELNDDGFFDTPVEEFSEELNIPQEKVLEALKLVQSFEPAGIAARNLKECFINQLEPNLDMADLAEVMIERYFQMLAPKHFKKIASEQKCSLEEVIEAFNLIRTLDPRPALTYSMKEVEYVIPDVIVLKVKERGYRVLLNNDDLPNLKVSEDYDDILTGKRMQKEEKEFILDKKRDAGWFIKCIEQRKQTILKVAQCIVNMQIDFFEKGIAFLKPMVLKDVANEIGMHESTISRVTTHKYMQTPMGLFEFKYFFHSRIDSHLGNEVSSLVVKELIKKLVAAEPKDKPLTDMDLVERLSRRDIKIARRTIAKYRTELKIGSTSQRKQLYSLLL